MNAAQLATYAFDLLKARGFTNPGYVRHINGNITVDHPGARVEVYCDQGGEHMIVALGPAGNDTALQIANKAQGAKLVLAR